MGDIKKRTNASMLLVLTLLAMPMQTMADRWIDTNNIENIQDMEIEVGTDNIAVGGPDGKTNTADSHSGPGINMGKKQELKLSQGITLDTSYGKVKLQELSIGENSKYIQFLWNQNRANLPDAKVYVFTPENQNGRTVTIDAGHGDNASPIATQRLEKSYPVLDDRLMEMGFAKAGLYGVGAQARTFKNVYNNAETEPEFTLKIALMVKDILLQKGYRVVLTRTESNQNISNGARAVLSSEISDILLSIHSNASTSKTARGTLAFYPGDADYISGKQYPGYTSGLGLLENQAKSKKLAELVGKKVSQNAGFSYNGTYSAVLRLFSYSSIPVSLVEVGFSDQIDDAKILIEKKNEIAMGIVEGIENYYSGN